MKYWVWILLVLTGCIGPEFQSTSGGTEASGTTTDSSTSVLTASVAGSGGGGADATSTVTTGGEGGIGQTTTSTGGSTSTSSSNGGGGTGGSGTGGSGGCEAGEKDCDGTCVAVNDPDFGCASDSCEPCDLVNAVAACSGGQCVIDACLEDFEDCDDENDTGCEADLMNDLDHCGACNDSCSVTGAACETGTCMGPCGEVPVTGLHVCWVYGALDVPSNQFVGLAGGAADPALGDTIEEKFLDPWCVNPNIGEPFVLCDLGDPDPDWDIQFRAGLHLTPSMGTIAGTWDCSDMSCAGEVYVYLDKNEIGSLITNVEDGVVSTLPHFNPPGLKNVKVTPP